MYAEEPQRGKGAMQCGAGVRCSEGGCWGVDARLLGGCLRSDGTPRSAKPIFYFAFRISFLAPVTTKFDHLHSLRGAASRGLGSD